MIAAFRTVFAAAVIAVATPAAAAPDSELWDKWSAHDPSSTQTVDHSAWSGLLAANLVDLSDGTRGVDYKNLRNSRAELQDYISRLASTEVSTLNRSEQFAYWVNLYNALTVETVLAAYPVSSIRDIDISPGYFSDGPWGAKLVTIEGEDVSLDDIEHRILRPIWNDPRIHYAVNCASVGCPDLFGEAVTPQNADAYLDRAARAYVNHPRGVVVEDGYLYVSSIYKWFEEDFGDSTEGVIAHVRQYAEPKLANALNDLDEIRDTFYDWSLNDAERPVRGAEPRHFGHRPRGGS